YVVVPAWPTTDTAAPLTGAPEPVTMPVSVAVTCGVRVMSSSTWPPWVTSPECSWDWKPQAVTWTVRVPGAAYSSESPVAGSAVVAGPSTTLRVAATGPSGPVTWPEIRPECAARVVAA